MSNWVQDGQPVDSISIGDRGFQYGDGVFETIAIRSGAPRLWDYHVERLIRSCEFLELPTPSESELIKGVEDALSVSGVSSAYATVKIILTAGTATRGYGRRKVVAPTMLYGGFIATPPPKDAYAHGVRIILCETQLARDSAFAGLKTLNRLEQVRARSEVISDGAYEGLTMDADGNIICGTMSNVFFVRDKKITTPSLERCGVSGVMRRHILELLAQQGVDVEMKHTGRKELSEVDEIFLSNSQFGLMPIYACEDHRWSIGEVTRNLMADLAQNGFAECRL